MQQFDEKMNVEQVFKALADANRLRIVNLLLHGELCVCDIQYVLENSQPNISRHLAYLKNSGMVVDRRDGYRVFYRIANPKESSRKLLFDFLRQIFKDEDQLEQDTKRLKDAIASGSCTISEWKPYSAIEKSRTSAYRCLTAQYAQLNLATGQINHSGVTLRSRSGGSLIGEAGSREKIALAKPKRYIDKADERRDLYEGANYPHERLA